MIDISLEGKEPWPEVRAILPVMERNGIDTVWLACHLFQREPIARAAALLSASDSLKIALMAMSPYTVHPVYAAMAAATLEEMFPGRVTLCLGVGAPRDLEAAGVEAPKPLATLREAIAVTRGLFAGETVHHDGTAFSVRGRRLETGACAVPVALAASGPKMLELAGEAADAVLISAAASVPFLQSCLETVAEGEAKAGRRIRRIGLLYAAVAEQEAAAHAGLKRMLGFILRGAHHARNIELGGSSLDQAALAKAYAAEDWPAVERLVSDEIVARHAASGTPEQVRARMAEYQEVGLDRLVLSGVSQSPDLEPLLRHLGRPA
ncbi:LLM class flavin-dependent oxidoreductase [Marinibaculum pumilum]|uniref:LLM class flavin-dependent oxidoreductase n=1 Tax=Marinibaculum pumilum TaxID=1766165 RepID=A0ABV7KZG2_9PROT